VSDISNIFGEKVIKQMIKEFEKHDNCIFKARLEEKFLPERNIDPSGYSTYKNIVFTEKSTKQQNILCNYYFLKLLKKFFFLFQLKQTQNCSFRIVV